MEATSITRLLLLLPLLLLLAVALRALPLPVCRNNCGPIAINYPFGLDDGCGSPEFRRMLNCSAPDLFFLTPSGSYKVRSIDYDKQTVVMYDPGMSTCNALQPHHDFVLSDLQAVVVPPSSDTVFALLNCSIDSPVLNRYRSLCFNFSGHSCDELYAACTSFQMFNVTTGTGRFPPCCFTDFSTVKFMSMNILDCSHYTTVYGADDLKGIGPMDWSYGIELSYTIPNAGCEHCAKTGGTCGYNTETEGMICICSSFVNSSRVCAGGAGGSSSGDLATGGGNAVAGAATVFWLLLEVVRLLFLV
ncbi:hypothetical protein H6P81_004418 [Aristolochia fimbriata]|uniref:Wall-associated receptor kinase galacturonan-binding domain-containing protein n=1 Tax=Aristolochia fimbriata TaxID=158543 RepID=A0AAV7FHJ0_ARIFI|nr:hypothetical protein H6P81_004418 [Aristolochia fimbriata]